MVEHVVEPRSLLDYKGYVFDLDGTIYLGSRLIPGVDTMLAKLRERDCKIRFLSNKPLQTRREYARKLRSLGVQADDSEVMNSSAVTTRYLRQNYPSHRIYVVGEAPLIGELLDAGFQVVSDSSDCDLLLLAFDRNFDYLKLFHAMLAARQGVPIVATNPDVACPVEGGLLPDCGAVIAAVEACSSRKVDIVVGKPSPIMIAAILEDLDLAPADVLLVGDRLETDISMGVTAGMATALVLTGATTAEQVPDWPDKPTYVLPSAAAISGNAD